MFFRKLFCSFFFEKTPPKMPQNNSCIKLFNARVAEIYQMLSNIWDLGDAVMYNPDIDNNTKCVFLAWYQMKLTYIKEELDQITFIING